jgi:hypothetical protein
MIGMGDEKWTSEDTDVAYREGWGLFDSDGEVRIEKVDERGLLADDATAWHIVAAKAREGSKMHQKALRLVSKAERERIRKETKY